MLTLLLPALFALIAVVSSCVVIVSLVRARIVWKTLACEMNALERAAATPRKVTVQTMCSFENRAGTKAANCDVVRSPILVAA